MQAFSRHIAYVGALSLRPCGRNSVSARLRPVGYGVALSLRRRRRGKWRRGELNRKGTLDRVFRVSVNHGQMPSYSTHSLAFTPFALCTIGSILDVLKQDMDNSATPQEPNGIPEFHRPQRAARKERRPSWGVSPKGLRPFLRRSALPHPR